MLSRARRVPSAATQLHESPCFPPVDWMTKWRAFAGGRASSVGTCANPEATTASRHPDSRPLILVPPRRPAQATSTPVRGLTTIIHEWSRHATTCGIMALDDVRVRGSSRKERT